ncbi:MAG: hypothetical protein AB7G47_15425 [Mycolicibacterium sp.]|uniref:hypothetical protein n=1 Tax=Mycolicibacterium sp. TaxID=2320850 RepID=UPI003D0BCD98
MARSSQQHGQGRAASQLPFLRWLQVGAVAAGVGAGMLVTSAVAAADAVDSAESSESSSVGSSDRGGATSSTGQQFSGEPVPSDKELSAAGGSVHDNDGAVQSPTMDVDDAETLAEQEALNAPDGPVLADVHGADTQPASRADSADNAQQETPGFTTAVTGLDGGGNEPIHSAADREPSGDEVDAVAVGGASTDRGAPVAAAAVRSNGVSVDPVLELTDGVITGDLRAHSARGLPMKFAVLGPGSNGGRLDLSSVTAGAFTVLPYATWLDATGVKQTEQFGVRVSEVTPFDEFVARIPLVGDLALSVIALLQQTPVLNSLLAPLIGGSVRAKLDVDVAALAPGDTEVEFVYKSYPFVEGSKPGLISSDWLTVVSETGEFNGDEPVMVHVIQQMSLGQGRGSTVASVMATGEIGSGVDAGATVRIPNSAGDIWFDRIKPLTMADLRNVAGKKTNLAVPVIFVTTVMLEGDYSTREFNEETGWDIQSSYWHTINPPLEAIQTWIPEDLDVNALISTLTSVQRTIVDNAAVAPASLIADIDARRARKDVDDPVGMSYTALVPVDAEVLEHLIRAGALPKLGLDSQFLRLDTKEMRWTQSGKNKFGVNAQIRTGLLVPPGTTPYGKPQTWTTTYAGEWETNRWADYKVPTDAWPQVTW